MKPPCVPRHARPGFMRDLREFREADCQFPRGDGRPRCGRCIGCGSESALEVGFHTRH